MRNAFLCSIAFAGLTVSGRAALVMNETFSYANGPLTTVSAGVWARFGGGTNQLDVLTGRAHLTQAESEDDARTFGSFTVGTVYYSFVLNASSLPSGTGNGIAHLKDSATGARAIAFVTTAGAAAGRYRVGVANGATTPSGIVAFDLAPGIDYRVVVCYSQSAAGGPPQTVLWINPCSEQDTVRRTMAQDSFNPATLTSFALRQEVAIGVLDIDNLRIGTTFADVASDTTPPILMCPSNIVTKCTSPAGTPVSYNVTATDNCDSAVTLVCTPSSGSLFPLGNTLVTCTATDDAGNVSRCTFTVTVVDTDPPVINCPSNIVAKCTNSAGTRVTYTVTATDNCDSNVTVVCVPPSGSLFPLGVTLVTCTATDDATNQSRCTFTVTVRDFDPPTIRCPSNIVVNSTGPNGAQVFYVVTATDDCDPTVTLVCTPPSGSIFPNGVTVVNCTATDDSGNQSRCSFTVTVVRPVEIDRFPESRAQVTILFPDGSEELLDLAGPTEVHVFVGPAGEASDSNGNGRDDVETEMIQLDLLGTSSRLGPVQVRLRSPDRHPFMRSLGKIEEILNPKPGRLDVMPFAPAAEAGDADSFFDIFVEIQVNTPGPGLPPILLHTDRPKRMRAIIRHKPPEPGGTYFNPDILDLLNENNQPTGFRIGRTSHTPNPPPPEIDYFPNSQAQITLQVPGRPDETVMLVGPTTVHVAVGPNGQATDSNNNQLDDVKTEIVQLELTGDSSLGPVLVRLRDPTKAPFMRSMGMIEETANTQTGRLDLPPFAPTGNANSFFDVFFEVVVANQILHTEIPKRMQAVIHHKPPEPGGTYENPESIELLTEDGRPAGVRIGRSSHVPNPRQEVDVFNYTLATLLIQLPGGANEAVTVSGSSTAVVNVGPAGEASDTDGDGLDQVESELVALDLAGTSTLVGPINVRLRSPTKDPFMRSLGEIEETANTVPGRLDLPPFAAGGTANSFFDVFFEIEVPAGPFAGVYHADRPKRMRTVIRHKPPAPGDTYESVDLGQIELLDENNKPTGVLVGHANHTPNPLKERDSFSYSQGKIVLQYPNGQNERIIVAGPTEVLVCIPPNGQAADSDGDGLDDVPTEMISMNLAGSSSLGPVMVTLDPTRCRSLGQIEEKANNTPGTLDLPPFRAAGSANSFFDVCFKIEVAGRVFRPCQGPVRLGSMITHKPPAPGEAYMNLFTEAVDLCDENGNPTGIRIIQEMHTPNPEKETDYFSYSQGKINLRHPDGHIERIIVAGPTEVQVCIDPTGLAADTDFDGLDQVPTQMTLLNLMGNSSLGPVMVSLNPNQPSNGGIEEKVNATPGVLDLPPFTAAGSANSFFDVFALIKVGNQILHPASRLHIESMITHKPPAPGEAYMNLVDQTIDLLDANNRPTGFQITGEMHTPNIPKETDYFSYSQGKINLRLPNGQTERVIVAGPTEVQVCLNDQDGLAADTDADGLDEVPTQMTQLMLQGNSSLGPITVMLDPTRPSLGQIEEKVNGTPGVLDLDPFGNKGCANSFFDVWVKILVGGQAFCVTQALHIEAMICHKPPLPGEAYMNLVTQNIQLFNCANGQPSGIFITGEMHTPQIPRETDFFSYSQGKINIRHPNGQIERVIVAGPTEVQVGLNDADGLAADTDGDGLDQVPTQMTQLMLQGNSSLGPVMVMLDPNQPSLGEIEEKVNGTPGVLDVAPFGNQGCANSYFLVYARIKVGNFVLCPAQPLRIESMICHKPPLPGEAYMNLVEQQIPLLDCASGQPTGYVLTGEMHTPNIPKETDYFSYSQGKINLRLPNGQTERVIVAGPTEVQVCLNDQDGLAADTDADGLDEVPTQMTQLMLQGNSSLGPITVMLDPTRPSLGQIEEKVNGTPGVLDLDPFGNKGCANSFFDVWVKILVGGQAFCVTQALHIEAMICHKPPLPGEAYMNLVTQNIQLFNCANGQPSGIFITGEMHTPQIPRETDFFSYSQGKINIRHPNGQIERVIVAGPTEVQVGLNDADGLAADTDGDGLDQVPTQMTQLMLQGNSSLGPVMVMLDPNQPSLGEIEEKVNGTPGVLDVAPFGNQGCANSYFLVYARIKVGNFVLCPAQPLRIESMICHKPPLPGEAYMNLVEQQIPLLDCASGQPTGYVLTGEMHTPNIPKETDYFSYSQGKIVLRYTNGQTERIIVAGPTEVQVCINDQDGFAADTDGDGLDEVPTEMTLLDLRGVSSQGPVVVSLDPAQCRSLGQIEEKVSGTPGVLDLAPFGNQGAANSFFNVCFKMQVGARVFHTCRPVRISSMITHKPPAPGEAYMNLIDDIVELCDENGNPTGIQIIQEMHTPVIPKEIDFFPSSYAELDVRGPTGQTETIRLTGPSRVQVCIAPDGLAADTDGDGLDQVPTEMTQLDLSGVSTSLGAIQIRLDPNRRSLGEIEEQVNNTMGTLDVPPFTATGRADSFFDVFAEFHVGNQVFHTAEPLHMQAVITHKPPAPGETYVNPFTQPIAILDANGNPTGFVLLREIHTPNPTNCVSIICPPDIAVWSCSNSAVINFSVQATNRCSAVQPTVVCVPASGSLFPTGMTMVVCTASVAGSPPQSCVFKVTVNADTEPPRLFCPSNLVVWTCSPNGVPVNFNVLATDDCDTNVTVTCTRGGSVVQSGSVFPVGASVVVCTARDDCGKVSTCSFTVTVIRDVEPPRLVCPSNLVVQTCADGERVFYSVTATDDCDTNVAVFCNPPSGSFFPVGVTAVHCVAVDDCGHTNECRFTVTVGLQLQVRHIPGGLLEICWPTNCPDFKLQCTHDLGKPILWLPVTNTVVTSNGMFCVRVDNRGAGAFPRFYRLIRYTPQAMFSPTDTLPPAGAFKSMPGDGVPFFNGIQLRWLVARINPPPPPPTNPPCLTCPQLVMTFPATMEFQYSMDEGRHFDNARALANVTVAVAVEVHPEPKRFFNTELLAMNISGGTLPAGVMIRESPTLASRGQHCIATADGGFMIFSFFDLWLEVSLNGGQTWSPALCPAHVDWMPMPPEFGSMTDRLPPTGRYNSPPGVMARYAGLGGGQGLILRRIVHDIVPGGTNPKPPPCLTCPGDTQELNAMVSFEASMDGGQSFMPMSAPGRTMVRINHTEDTADTSFFDVEILSMDIMGGGLPMGVMIRESPTMPSKGFLSIRNSPSLSQPYFIGSFFDVWTDLSVDGGQSWLPSMDPTHVELQPDP